MNTKFKRLNHDDIIRSFSKLKDLKKVSDEMSVSEFLVKKTLINSGIDYNFTKIKPKERVVGSLDHKEVIKKYNEIGHTKSTAKYYNISVTSLVKILHLNGVKIKKIKITDDEIIKKYNETKKIISVSNELKLSEKYISNVLRRNNIDILYPNKSGINIGNVYGKLTIIDIEKYVTSGGNSRLKYVCKCECGNVVKWRSQEINVEGRTNCGCVYLKKLEDKKRIREELKKVTEEKNRIKLLNRKSKKIPLFVEPKYHAGVKKGRWTILSTESKGKLKKVTVECECGKIKTIGISSFYNSNSCGCLQVDKSTKHGNAPKNDDFKRKWYDRWRSMIKRCYVEKNKAYHNYGGRGIKVCDRWLEPNGKGCKNYIKDIFDALGSQPSSEHSLDRIDNDGMYTIENMRWATNSEQSKNQRRFLKTERV